MLLIDLAKLCRNRIESARQTGLTIDNGNVVDLIADNCEESLTDIKAALVVAGYHERFSKAIHTESHQPYEEGDVEYWGMENFSEITIEE